MSQILPFSLLVCSTNPFAAISSLAKSGQSQPPVPLVNPNSYTWAISGGMPFKNFFYGNTGGKVDLAASDLQLPQFKFFTVDRGDITISSDFIVDPPSGTTTDGNPLSFHLSETAIESVRPTLETWDIASGQVQKWEGLVFGFGPPAEHPGQLWTSVQATLAEFPTNGDCGFVQLINAKREFRKQISLSSAMIYRNTSYGVEVLDNGIPYDPPQNNGTTLWPISTYGTNSDSPNQNFSLFSVDPNDVWIYSSADDSFRTWVMYKPDSKDLLQTTWVPLGIYTWQWNGQVQRSDPQHNWSQVTGSHSKSSWSSTTSFPQWTQTLGPQINFVLFTQS